MYCTNCGFELKEGNAFCTNCGTRVPSSRAGEKDAPSGQEPVAGLDPAVAPAPDSDDTPMPGKPSAPEEPPTPAEPPAPEEPPSPGKPPMPEEVSAAASAASEEPPAVSATVPLPAASPSPDSAPSDATPSDAPTSGAAEGAREGASGSPRRKIAIVVAAVAVVVAVGIGAFFVARNVMGNQRHAVAIAIEAPKYDEGASRIPLHVTGENSSGAAVDEVAYVDASGSGLELAAGEYDVAPAASPLLSDGNVYKVPEGSIHVSVGTDGTSTATGSVGAQKKDDKNKTEEKPDDEGKITFTVADSKTVSDAQLADARRYADGDTANASKADELAKKAEEKRAKATGGAKNDQERLAFAFVRTYFDSVKLGDADASGYLKMTQRENWKQSCRGYIAKDTKLFNEFVPEKTKGSKNPAKDFPWGCPDGWMIFSKAKVVESTDKKTKVNVEFFGGNGSIKANYKDTTKPSSADIVITFDDNNKIVGLERAKANQGK